MSEYEKNELRFLKDHLRNPSGAEPMSKDGYSDSQEAMYKELQSMSNVYKDQLIKLIVDALKSNGAIIEAEDITHSKIMAMP